MNLRYTLLYILLLVFSDHAFCQTQKDTIYAVKSEVPVIVDGSDEDACWSEAVWKPIDKVWLPTLGAKMVAGDFEGKYKVAWDADYLYLLVEVKDDMLSDDHVAPLDNYWNDDCVEIFIDEDRSKGNHLTNYNAFAYHVSLTYDVIDGGTGTSVNLKNNMTVVMDTIGEDTYLWEFAVKIYNKNFNPNNPEASRVTLTPKKLMGFTIAYCDNDQTTSRENFIGSMEMTEATKNDNYITADYFGSLLLSDQQNTTMLVPEKKQNDKLFSVFPNPANDILNLEKLNNKGEKVLIELFNIAGVLQKKMTTENTNQLINLSDEVPGIYFLKISSENKLQSERIIIR